MENVPKRKLETMHRAAQVGIARSTEQVTEEGKSSAFSSAPAIEQVQVQKSSGPTGPRTSAGKEIASQNSTTHGIFAERLRPSEAQSAAMLEKQLQTEFNPRGAMERNIVQRLTRNLLERERIDRWADQQRRLAEFDRAAEVHPREVMQPAAHDEPSIGALRRHLGNYTPNLLRGLQKLLEKKANINQDDLAQLERLSGSEITPESEKLMRISATILRVRGEDRSDPVSQLELEAYCEHTIKLISLELKVLEARTELELGRAQLEVSADYVTLPREDVSNLIQRYRAANDRERSHLF